MFAQIFLGAGRFAAETLSGDVPRCHEVSDDRGVVQDRVDAQPLGYDAEVVEEVGVMAVEHQPAGHGDNPAEQRGAAEDERKRTAEEDVAGRVEQRRIQAILSAYSSEREIESARENALGPVLEVIGQTEGAIANLDKRLADLKPEIDALGAKPMPGKLRNAVKTSESERSALAQLLETKRTEEKGINARFEEDRRRYVEGSREVAARRASRLRRPSKRSPKSKWMLPS